MDDDFVAATLQHESKGNPYARGSSGELGIAQLMPENIKKFGVEDPFDPVENTAAAIRLLEEEFNFFGGDYQLTAAAYNAGRPNVIKAAEKAGSYDFEALRPYLPKSDKYDAAGYVDDVMGIYSNLKSQRTEDSQAKQNETDDSEERYGTPKELASSIEDLVTQDGFDALPPREKLQKLSRLHDGRKWVPEANAVLKDISSLIWQEMPDKDRSELFSAAAPYLANVTGENDEAIAKNGDSARNSFSQVLRDGGITPEIYGNEIDNLFNEKTKDEQARVAAKDRSVLGTASRVAAEFTRGAAEGYTSALAAIPKLAGQEEIGNRISDAPRKFFGETRELDYETNEDGTIALDENGQPINRYRGTVIRGMGQVASLLAGGALLKGAGYGLRTISALMGGTNALSSANAAYDEARSEGGDYQEGLMAALVAMPVAAGAALADASILASDKAYIGALTGMNRTRAVARVAVESAFKAGTANVVTEAGIGGGVAAATGENNLSTERLALAFGIGAVPGGVLGGFEALRTPRTTAVQPQPQAKAPLGLPAPEVHPALPPGEPRLGIRVDSRPGLPPPEDRGLPPPPSGPTIRLGEGPASPEAQMELGRKFEDFQKSFEDRTVLSFPRNAEIPPELLNIFGYDAQRLTGDEVLLTKRRNVPLSETRPEGLSAIDAERQRITEELDSSPHPEDHRDLILRRSGLKKELSALERNLGRDVTDTNSLAELRRSTQNEINKNRVEYKRTEDDTLKGVLDLEYEELKARYDQIQEGLSQHKEKLRAVDIREEISNINDALKKLSDPLYTNNLKAQEARLVELGNERAKLLEATNEFVEQHPFKEFAVKVETEFGDRFALPYKDRWHVLDNNGKVLTRGHWTLKDALDTARQLDMGYTPDIQPMRSSAREAIKRGQGLTKRVEQKIGIHKEVLPQKKLMKDASFPKPEPKPPRARGGKGSKGGKRSLVEGESAATAPEGTEGEVASAERDLELSPRNIFRLAETKPRVPVSKDFVSAAPHTREGGFVRTGEKEIPVTDLMEKGRKIVAALRSGTPVGIAEGGRIKPGVLGYFRFNKNYIRLGRLNDFPTLVHEATHAIDKFALSKWDPRGIGDYSDLPPEVQQGLIDTANTYYAVPLPTRNLQLAEGFAMFAQHYVTGQKVHRAVRDWFRSDFANKAPKEFQGLQELRKAAFEYYGQKPRVAFRAFRSSEPPTSLDRLGNYLNEGRWKDDWIDRKNFWSVFDKHVGTNVKDVADARQNTANHVANYLINEKIVDWNGNAMGSRALRDFVEPLEKTGKVDLLVDYMTAKRFKEDYARNNIEPGAPLEDIFATLEEIESKHPEVVQAANGWWDSWTDILTGLEASSPLAERYFTRLKEQNLKRTGTEHGFYVPIQREGKGPIRLGAKRVGSFRTVENFMNHVQPILRGMLQAADRQNVLHYFLTKISDPLLPTGGFGAEVTDDVTRRALDSEFADKVKDVKRRGSIESTLSEGKTTTEGLDEAFLKDAVAFLDPALPNVHAADGFVFLATPDGQGKMRYYEIPERGWETFSNKLPEWTSHPLFNMLLKGPKKLLQATATVLRPAFLFTNAPRDLQTLYRRSNGSLFPLMQMKYTAEALQQSIMGKLGSKNLSRWVELSQALGLQGSTRLASEGYLERLSEKNWKIVDFADHTFAKAAEVMSTFEEGLRLSAMIEKAHELNISENSKLTPEQVVELSLAYKRSTTDFSVQGKKARVVNFVVPFFTARIAETAQLAHDIKKQPGRVAAIGLGWLTLGAYYAWAHKDEDWYREMNPEDRGKWYHTPIEKDGEKRLLRMPLDSWGSMMFTTGQGLASAAYEQGDVRPEISEFAGAIIKGTLPVNVSFDSFKDFSASFSELGGPLVKEYIQQIANRDFYFRKGIVPRGLEYQPNERQFTEYTTELAKTIGELTGSSPVRWDHTIRSLTPVAADATRIFEDLTGLKRPKGKEGESLGQRLESRIIEGSLRYGLSNDAFTRSDAKFYELLDKYQKNKDEETPEDRGVRLKLNEIHNRLSAISTVSSQVEGKERDELAEKKKKLLQEAFELGKGEKNIQLESAPKGQAKAIRKEKSRKAIEEKARNSSD